MTIGNGPAMNLRGDKRGGETMLNFDFYNRTRLVFGRGVQSPGWAKG